MKAPKGEVNGPVNDQRTINEQTGGNETDAWGYQLETECVRVIT